MNMIAHANMTENEVSIFLVTRIDCFTTEFHYPNRPARVHIRDPMSQAGKCKAENGLVQQRGVRNEVFGPQRRPLTLRVNRERRPNARFACNCRLAPKPNVSLAQPCASDFNFLATAQNQFQSFPAQDQNTLTRARFRAKAQGFHHGQLD